VVRLYGSSIGLAAFKGSGERARQCQKESNVRLEQIVRTVGESTAFPSQPISYVISAPLATTA
jgi:hypothetical protein